jgi:hypothetical protein
MHNPHNAVDRVYSREALLLCVLHVLDTLKITQNAIHGTVRPWPQACGLSDKIKAGLLKTLQYKLRLLLRALDLSPSPSPDDNTAMFMTLSLRAERAGDPSLD